MLGSCAPAKDSFLQTYQEPAAQPPADNPAPTPAPSGYYLIIASQAGNHVSVSKYDLSASALAGELVADFRLEGDSPRGLAPFDKDHVLLAGEGSDSVYKINLNGSKTIFHSTANINGNLFDMTRGPLGLFYLIETNMIEVLDAAGVRQAGSVVATTTGSCVLNVPRSMAVNANSQLLVTNTGGTDQLLFYNISTAIPTCVRAVNIGNDPVGIRVHSNGNIYMGTQLNDRIVRVAADGTGLTTIWNTNTAIINDPSAIVELPESGDLLVASFTTSTVERLTVSGARVGSNPYIMDALSLNIIDMMIIKKEDGSEF